MLLFTEETLVKILSILLKTYVIVKVCLQKSMQASTSLFEISQTDRWEVPCDKPLNTHTRGHLRKLILTESLVFSGVYMCVWLYLTA